MAKRGSVSAFFYGLSVGFSLIVAIGAQNAFVLKQGLKREFVFWVCLICALSDAILIGLGVFGFGRLLLAYPWFVVGARYFGAAFLLAYGARSFWAAVQGGSGLAAAGADRSDWQSVILMCLALTWLNPHVYLDTVVLMGSISAQFESPVYFALGAMAASWIFFFALGYGARVLAPIFAKAVAWRFLDGLIAGVMWVIAVSLLLDL